MDCGAHGCIPSSIGIDVLFPAMKLTRAGGVFLPMSVVLSIRSHLKSKAPPTPDFGARQLFDIPAGGGRRGDAAGEGEQDHRL